MDYSLQTGAFKSLRNLVITGIPTVVVVLAWTQANCNLDAVTIGAGGLTVAFVSNIVLNYLKQWYRAD